MLKIISAGAAVLGVVILVLSIIVGWVVAPKIIDNKVEKVN